MLVVSVAECSTQCRSSGAPARQVSAKAMPVEVMQLANEAAFISGVAGTMISMTMIVRIALFVH